MSEPPESAVQPEDLLDLSKCLCDTAHHCNAAAAGGMKPFVLYIIRQELQDLRDQINQVWPKLPVNPDPQLP